MTPPGGNDAFGAGDYFQLQINTHLAAGIYNHRMVCAGSTKNSAATQLSGVFLIVSEQH